MRRLLEHPLAGAGAQDNAMTEVALALAMGFFSIVVLMLISMGSGNGTVEPVAFEAVPVVRALTDSPAATRGGEGDRIVLFDGTRFLDTQLRPVDPRTLMVPDGGRLVLAVSPELTFAQVSDARRAFATSDLVVTTLDARWTDALARGGKAGAP